MAIDNKLLDDLAKVAGGAASLFSTVRRQVQSDLRERVDSYADRMDMAPRTEVERLQALVAKLRTEQETLKQRIAALEALSEGKKKPAVNQNKPKATKKKTASKSRTKK